MYIGFYSEPINSSCRVYRGLYRNNNLVDFYNHKSPSIRNNIDWFFSKSFEGMYIVYTRENLLKLQALHNRLSLEGWYGDMLFFSDTNCPLPPKCAFLGYDVCADSKYYSPIGDGFLDNYSRNNVFFTEMGLENYREYVIDLNENGLFSSYEIAQLFAKYCNSINKKYDHAVETECNWRPFAIYCIKQRQLRQYHLHQGG